jgi:hypothetical protein
VTGEVQEFCGSIGGCRYFVDLVGPDGLRHHADFEYGSGLDISIPPAAVPHLSPGRHGLTASFEMCSDAIMNGVRECGPVVATCDTEIDVRAGTGAVAIRAVFRQASCTIEFATS